MNRKEELEKRKADLLRRLEDEPPFNKKTFDANMKAAFGTFREWAQMQDDGTIGVRSSGYASDGSHGTGGFVVSPNDEDYEKAKQYYGLSKPGETYHLQQECVDGQWVTVLEERPDQKPEPGEAEQESKTA
ncbi:MAG: hypothetical protein K8F91_05220 [Candidatus Obscuribacterales bacterium]|nr:hypothetical protein [Candidatus Obscuribacterales bacterium]